MNIFAIIIPGILNFLCWFLHLNATHRMSIIKFLAVVATTICPVANIVTLAIFLIAAILRADDINNCREIGSNHPLGFGEKYDYTTISGRILLFFTLDR